MSFKKTEDYKLTHMLLMNGQGPLIINPILDNDNSRKRANEESIFKTVNGSAVVDFGLFPIMYTQQLKDNEKSLKLDKRLDKDTIVSPRFCAGWNWLAVCKKSNEAIFQKFMTDTMLDTDILLYPYEQSSGVVFNFSRVLFLDMSYIAQNMSLFAYDCFEGCVKRIGSLPLNSAFDHNKAWQIHPMTVTMSVAEINKMAIPMRGVMEPKTFRDMTEDERARSTKFSFCDAELGAEINRAEIQLFGKIVSGLGNLPREGWEHGHPTDETISDVVELITEKRKSGKFELPRKEMFELRTNLKHMSSCLLCMRTIIESFHPLFFEVMADNEGNDLKEQELLRQLATEKFLVTSVCEVQHG